MKITKPFREISGLFAVIIILIASTACGFSGEAAATTDADFGSTDVGTPTESDKSDSTGDGSYTAESTPTDYTSPDSEKPDGTTSGGISVGEDGETGFGPLITF